MIVQRLAQRTYDLHRRICEPELNRGEARNERQQDRRPGSQHSSGSDRPVNRSGAPRTVDGPHAAPGLRRDGRLPGVARIRIMPMKFTGAHGIHDKGRMGGGRPNGRAADLPIQ